MIRASKIARIPIVAALATLCACQEEAPLGDLEQPANIGPVGFSNFVDLSETEIAATINPAFGFGPIQNEAKSLCTDKPVCKVTIFEEATNLPAALPYTDREIESAIGVYTLDRTSGEDALEVRCPAIPRTPQESCLGN